jgi:DnaD/phage-associated family protein
MTEPKQPYRIKDRPPTIYRVVKSKDNPYVMIDRRPIENPTLSFKAKGILTYLLSRPDGWEVSVADLIKRGTDGEAGVRAGLKELKNAGHMKYTTSRKAGRITGWLIEVYEVPDGDFLQVEILDVEKQDVENRTQVLSTLSNKEIKQEKEEEQEQAQVFRAYSSEIGMLTPMIADSINGWIKDGFPVKWMCDAIHEAALQNKRNWKYCEAIIKRWDAQGNQEAMKRPEVRTQSKPMTKQDQSLLNIQSWLNKQDNPNGI